MTDEKENQKKKSLVDRIVEKLGALGNDFAAVKLIGCFGLVGIIVITMLIGIIGGPEIYYVPPMTAWLGACGYLLYRFHTRDKGDDGDH